MRPKSGTAIGLSAMGNFWKFCSGTKRHTPSVVIQLRSEILILKERIMKSEGEYALPNWLWRLDTKHTAIQQLRENPTSIGPC